jgi:2-polyprenyl-3-methyl-5-hydroxy-6-metoxy-1,4-benzoquinol methylase
MGGQGGGVGISARTLRKTSKRKAVRPLGGGCRPRLLDIACGSGFAAPLAFRRGAVVAGLDAPIR